MVLPGCANLSLVCLTRFGSLYWSDIVLVFWGLVGCKAGIGINLLSMSLSFSERSMLLSRACTAVVS